MICANSAPVGYLRRYLNWSLVGTDVARVIPSAETMSPRLAVYSLTTARPLRGLASRAGACTTCSQLSCTNRATNRTMMPEADQADLPVHAAAARRWPRRPGLHRRRGLGVMGNTQQQRQQDVVGDQRRSAVGDEGQGDAGQGDQPGHAADDDEGLDPEDQRQPGGQQLLERTVAADGNPQTRRPP